MSIEMASSVIIDLRSFLQRRDLHFDVMAVLEDQISLGMILKILLHHFDFGSFLMVAARSIVLAIFVPAATSSTMLIHALGFLAM
jgi:hypothetical protein